jgi:hypothetical protein
LIVQDNTNGSGCTAGSYSMNANTALNVNWQRLSPDQFLGQQER